MYNLNEDVIFYTWWWYLIGDILVIRFPVLVGSSKLFLLVTSRSLEILGTQHLNHMWLLLGRPQLRPELLCYSVRSCLRNCGNCAAVSHTFSHSILQFKSYQVSHAVTLPPIPTVYSNTAFLICEYICTLGLLYSIPFLSFLGWVGGLFRGTCPFLDRLSYQWLNEPSLNENLWDSPNPKGVNIHYDLFFKKLWF